MTAYREMSGDPQMECPKCGFVQAEAAACARCGLRRDLMATFEHEDGSDEMGPMWSELEQNWDSDVAHERFLNAVMTAGTFAYAARQYRGRGESDERVTHYLGRLEKMAVLTLSSNAKKSTPVGENPYKKTLVVFVLLVLLAAGALLYLNFRRVKAAAESESQPRAIPNSKEWRPSGPTRGIPIRGYKRVPRPQTPAKKPTQ